MAVKSVVFVLAAFLLVASRVSSNAEEQDTDVAVFAAVPVTAPAPAPAYKVMPPVSVKECPGLCSKRCSKHSRPNHCNRVCNTCCNRCKCVPPGPDAKKEVCGKCYTNMTTHGGRPKCP